MTDTFKNNMKVVASSKPYVCTGPTEDEGFKTDVCKEVYAIVVWNEAHRKGATLESFLAVMKGNTSINTASYAQTLWPKKEVKAAAVASPERVKTLTELMTKLS